MSRNNDGPPSWLTEENITTAASNPVVQNAAVSVASNPAVQKAAINHANKKMNEAAPGWASDPEPVRASNATQNSQTYVPPVVKGVPAEDVPAWSVPQDVERGNDGGNQGGRKRAMSDFVATDEEIKEIKKYHLILRVCFMCSALMMAISAVLTIQNASVSAAFMSMYVFFFAVMIFCFELGLQAVLKIVAANFGFMYTFFGRILLAMIICGMLAQLDVWGKVTIALLCASVAFNIFVVFKVPKYDEYLRKKHFHAEKL